MSFSRQTFGLPSTLAALIFSFALTQAQQCFYPDGKTVSTAEIPCNATATVSSCCRDDQFCLVGGLCFGGGIVSRGSCTDKTWQSGACAQVCTTESADNAIAITPCTSLSGSNSVNTFVCGVNTTGCQQDTNTFAMEDNLSFLLRPAQVAALVEPALAAQPPPQGVFSAGALAGVAIAIALPSAIALLVLGYLLRREKRNSRTTKPPSKAEYKLPDDISDEKYVWTSDEPVAAAPGSPSPFQQPVVDRSNFPIPVDLSPLPSPSIMSPVRGSRASSVHSGTSDGIRLTSGGTLAERYAAMKQNAQAQAQAQAQAMERHELESTPNSVLRYELGVKRMS